MLETVIERRGVEIPDKPEKMSKTEENERNFGNKDQKIIMQVENLSKTYFQGKIPVHALRCACITVRKGELLAIMGPSGSGKSTLLALIGTLEKATDGKIILDGTDLTSVPEKLLPRVRREKNRLYFPAL
ncbi:ATP-binding cassette domain-containing protein [Methanosarcina barkeri]|uniref:ATP-binding cassette domain-containing protein n=1 Tax=Methanosarcina barkeri TaxID=2208 RepID=UPI000A454B4B|nr:ATP-binding cassette domain-containing protein [Methanosarcina barkeri]